MRTKETNFKKQNGLRKWFLNITFMMSFICLVTIHSYGVTVKDTTAAKVAVNFLSEQMQSSLKSASISTIKISKTAVEIDNGNPSYYVFNFGNDNGFVIVSAEDAVSPILGYSLEGHFEGVSPSVKAWMGNYKSQINEARKNQQWRQNVLKYWQRYITKSNLKSSVSPVTPWVGPLLTTTWDQGTYYNALCTDNINHPGQNSYVGCVATALGQVIKYYNYPQRGQGSHTYTDPSTSFDPNAYCGTGQDPSWGTRTVNFANTTYNYANMPNKLTSANNDVATLLYDCGVSVNMDYGIYCTDGSGSSNYYIPNALKQYFNYYPTVQDVYKYSYSDASWIQMLKNEISSSRPVIYGGDGKSGGHSWVCDGYDAASNFHMNWGWNGTDNGWYSISSLTPNTVPDGFPNDNDAVIGIMPPPQITGPSLVCSATQFSVSNIPTGATIGWSFSSNLGAGNGGSNWVGISVSGNGAGWLKAIMNTPGCTNDGNTRGCYTTLPVKTLWVGSPLTPTFGYYAVNYIAPGSEYYIEVNPDPLVTSYWWSWTAYDISLYKCAYDPNTGNPCGIKTATGSNPFSTGTYPYIDILAATGSYLHTKVYVTAKNSCGSSSPGSADIYVCSDNTSPTCGSLKSSKDITEINKITDDEGINLFPNPVYDVLSFEGISDAEIIVFDLSGKKVLQFAKANNSVNVSALNQGIYIIQLKNDGKSYMQKIVKR